MRIQSGSLGTVLAGFVICAATGCGSGGGTATFSASLPASATVDTLSSTQQKQLCDEGTSFLEMLVNNPNFCHFTGVSAAASDAASNADWTDAQIQSDCTMWSQFCQELFSSGPTSTSCD